MIAGSPLVQSPASTFTPALPERVADLAAVDRRSLIDLAGQAPVGGEIDEHRMALRDVALGLAVRSRPRRPTAPLRATRGRGASDRQRPRRPARSSDREDGLPPAAPLHAAAASSRQTSSARPRPAEQQAGLPACRSSSHRQRDRRRAHRNGEEALQPLHPRPGLGQSRPQAPARSATTRNGSASPKPSAANTSTDPAAGSSSAVPSAAPRNGPAQGVATKAASAPVPKLPAGRALPPSTGSSNRPSRLAVIATASSSRSMIVRGSCSWNAQPACAPAGADREQRDAERAGADDRPRRIGQRIATAPRAASPPARDRCNAFSARIGKTQGIRLSRMPPASAPSTRPQDASAPSSPTALPPCGTGPGTALNSSPRPSPSASTPTNSAGAAPLRFKLGDQRVADASKALLRIIIDGAVGRSGRDRDRSTSTLAGQRDGDAQLVALSCEMRRRVASGRGSALPPCIELRAVAARRCRPAGRATSSPCSGTQILSVQASQRASARIGTVPLAPAGTFSRTSTRIIALVDIIHQPRDGQPGRHRIAQRAGGKALAEAATATSIGRPASPGFSQ